jgi:thiamine biosynthesis lipoprotein
MPWSRGLGNRSVVPIVLVMAGLVFCARAAPPDVHNPRVYRKQYAMGTVYEILAYSPSLDRASRAIDAAFQEIHRLDRMMNNYDPQSDLSRMNRTAHFRAVRVPSDLYRVIKLSLVYARLSDGKYDVTVGPLVDEWKSAIRRGQPPSLPVIDRLKACVGYRKVQLIPPDKIELHSDCMRIDLGSIGKGYAVVRAVTILRSYGVRNALINAGGSSIYGMGAPPGRTGWTVQLLDPSARAAPQVTLSNDGISTSGQGKTSLVDAGEFGHIIDPDTGQPIRSDFTVSVVSSTETASDGLSTTLFLMGPNAGAQLVRKLPDTAAVWISSAGQVVTASSGPKILFQSAQKASR